jgi:amphi-Trp domain-containing protein
MTDVKVEHKVTLTRQEAPRWIAEVAEALGGDEPVTIRLARSTVELEVPDHVRCEAEVEVDGDEVELEFELKWSIPSKATGEQAPDGDPPA